MFPGLALAASLLFSPAQAPSNSAPARALEVGSARAVPGQIVRGHLDVGEGADGSAVALPLTIVSGVRPGPVVWIQAGAHGDEYGGARALQDVVRSLDPSAMSGSVIAVFAANPPAFRALQRVNPNLDDLADMGDVFPGRERFATERIALAVFSSVRRSANAFVDLHTGGDRFRQHPFVFYTPTAGVGEARADALARGFGIPTLWRDTAGVFRNDATTVVSAAGIPAFLVEAGGGQPLDPADLRLQADAVRSFLRAMRVLPGEPARPRAFLVVTGYRIVTNRRGGFFEASVRPGERIGEGSVLGTISDVYGDPAETLAAPAGAQIVLGVSTYPATPTGGWLFEVGTGVTEVPADAPGPSK